MKLRAGLAVVCEKPKCEEARTDQGQATEQGEFSSMSLLRPERSADLENDDIADCGFKSIIRTDPLNM